METAPEARLKVQKLPLGYYVERMRKREPFTFVRYGDGEFRVIHKVHRADRVKCSGVGAYQNYSDDLRLTLDTPRACLRGLQGLVQRKTPNLIEPWKDLDWVDSDVLHHASIKGNLYPFIEQLSKMRICLIGPAYLSGLDFLNLCAHVHTPIKYCYLHKSRIWSRLCAVNRSDKPDVYLFSASGLTKILIWQMIPFFGGKRFLIDCGSMWEPFVGRSIRLYHKAMKPETVKKNREG